MRVRAFVPSLAALGVAASALVGCAKGPTALEPTSAAPQTVGLIRVAETQIAATLDAAGVAAPLQQSTLSTKLMGTVTEVYVREGDMVARGALLVRLDAKDLAAKKDQVGAGLAEAEAVLSDAQRQLERLTQLHEEKAAPKVLLEQAQTAHARALAAVASARAQSDELVAVGRYAEVRSPFAGQVIKRFVDPGAFAAPGAPLVIVQDASSLRASASIPPSAARHLERGQVVEVIIEGERASGAIEGVVPAAAGSLYTVNVVVANSEGKYLPGGAATVRVPQGERRVILVPERALVRQGDLVGVRVSAPSGSELRWVRTGQTVGDEVEVLSGLRAGDELVVADVGGR